MTDKPGRLLAEDVLGTRYPYINIRDNVLSVKATDFRRAISAINPFSYPQVPSQDRMAFGPRDGNGWYNHEPYPNGVRWGKMFPAHFDPLHEQREPDRYQVEQSAPGPYSNYVLTCDKLPRPCVRTIQELQRCEMVNGKSTCPKQEREILEICPAWALDSMVEKKKFFTKVATINANQYRRAMEVSPYNVGRTMKDISDKTWIDGTRKNLRPDTLWADERYTKITQSEINEAKKRMEERKQKAGQQEVHAAHEHHYDYKHILVKEPKPLYP